MDFKNITDKPVLANENWNESEYKIIRPCFNFDQITFNIT